MIGSRGAFVLEGTAQHQFGTVGSQKPLFPTSRTHSCAASLLKNGITVNAIAPALIETDMVTSNPNANPNLIPMGHFGSVDDIASVAVMLAMNDYMTGQTISVNGGWYMS